MFQKIEGLIRSFEAGTTSRRDLIAGFGAMLAGAMAAGRASAAVESAATAAQSDKSGAAAVAIAAGNADKPTFRAVGLNHIALNVRDLARSRDWYRKHLGLTVTREGENNCFMDCGPHFVALFKDDTAGMDHYCYSIEGYTAEGAVKTLEAAGIKPRRHGNRVYFDDPDGLTVQVAAADHAP